MEKAIPFSYCLGISTFSVPLEVLKNINKQRTTVAGLLFGNKGKTDICVEKSLELNSKKWNKNLIVIKDFCQENNTEFLGFYSHGLMPNERDIYNLRHATRSIKSSLFLLKFDYLNEDNMSALFECVFDLIHIERILIAQAHSTADFCTLINEIKPSDEEMAQKAKIFYIGFKSHVFDQLTRLDKLELPEAQKDDMIDNMFNIHPTCEEYRSTFHQIAVAEGLTSLHESLWDGFSMAAEPDFDYLKTLRDVCQKCKVDVTYNFEVLVNKSGEERVNCCIKILDAYIGTGFQKNIKYSYVTSTCAVLVKFCVET